MPSLLTGPTFAGALAKPLAGPWRITTLIPAFRSQALADAAVNIMAPLLDPGRKAQEALQVRVLGIATGGWIGRWLSAIYGDLTTASMERFEEVAIHLAPRLETALFQGLFVAVPMAIAFLAPVVAAHVWLSPHHPLSEFGVSILSWFLSLAAGRIAGWISAELYAGPATHPVVISSAEGMVAVPNATNILPPTPVQKSELQRWVMRKNGEVIFWSLWWAIPGISANGITIVFAHSAIWHIVMLGAPPMIGVAMGLLLAYMDHQHRSANVLLHGGTLGVATAA